MKSSIALVTDIGTDRIPVLSNGEVDTSIALTPGDYFLLSRVDGRTPIRAIRVMVGLTEDAFALAFAKVLASGMVRVPGVTRRRALDAVCADLGLDPADSTMPLTAAAPPTQPEPAPAPDPHANLWSNTPSTPNRGRADWAREDSKVRQQTPPRTGSTSGARVRGRYSSGSHAATPASEPVAVAPEKKQPPKKKQSNSLSRDLVPPAWPIRFEEFMFDPALMATGTAMDDVQKQVALYYHYHLRRVTYYDLFNLPLTATRTDVKLAYFRLSKAFHPDRWYRKDTGEFGTMIEDVFKWLNRAYGVLSSPKKRRGYDKLISRGYVGEWELERGGVPTRRPAESRAASAQQNAQQAAPPSAVDVGQGSPSYSTSDPEVRRTATLLIAKAGQAESAKDWERACDLYERVLQVSPSAHLRIRLVECMLQAKMETHEIEQQIEAARVAGVEEHLLLLAEARLAVVGGNPSKAAHRYAQVLDIDPENADALAGMKALRSDQAPAG